MSEKRKVSAGTLESRCSDLAELRRGRVNDVLADLLRGEVNKSQAFDRIVRIFVNDFVLAYREGEDGETFGG